MHESLSNILKTPNNIKKMKTYKHKPSKLQTSFSCIVTHLFELKQLFLLAWSAVRSIEGKGHAFDAFAQSGDATPEKTLKKFWKFHELSFSWPGRISCAKMLVLYMQFLLHAGNTALKSYITCLRDNCLYIAVSRKVVL